jgi:transcription antitermination factor NusG
MTRLKKTLKVGDNVVFNTGNYSGLTGVITEINWNSKHKNAICGYYHTVRLSSGLIGHIEKSEHWQFA